MIRKTEPWPEPPDVPPVLTIAVLDDGDPLQRSLSPDPHRWALSVTHIAITAAEFEQLRSGYSLADVLAQRRR